MRRGGVWSQIGLALLVAAVVLAGLQLWLARTARAAQAAAPEPPSLPAVVRGADLLATVRGPGAWLVYLATSPDGLPAEAAPVLELGAGGGLRLLRPPPRADEPRPTPWLAAGIVVPHPALAALTAVERAVLLDVWAALSGPFGLRADQIVARGIRTSGRELEQLLRWMR